MGNKGPGHRDWRRARIALLLPTLLALASVVLLVAGCRPLPATPTSVVTPTATLAPTTKVALVTPGTPAPTRPVTATIVTTTPSATLPPCGTPPTGWTVYTVEPGDALSVIAQWTGVSIEQLMAVNCRTSPSLQVGETLFLPPRPTPSPCGPPPAGWAAYVVQIGDTLSELASQAGISVTQAQEANCLPTTDLIAGQTVYLPPLPAPTATPCQPAPWAGWQLYIVRPGDTLSGLAVTHGTSTDAVMQANCLSSTLIRAGDRLYLPPLAIALATPVPPAAVVPAATPGCSLFTCRKDALPPFVAAVPKPNATPTPAFQCPAFVATPTITLEVEEPPEANWVERGQRVSFHVCGFAQSTVVTATISGPGVSWSVSAQQSRAGEWQVSWNASCFLPGSGELTYALTLDSEQGVTSTLSFTLAEPTQPRILALDRVKSPGRGFEIEYCGYPPGATIFDLYFKAAEERDRTVFRQADSWELIIPQGGRYRQSLAAPANAVPNVYAVADRNRRAADFIELVR
jgi:LysM repeat protein